MKKILIVIIMTTLYFACPLTGRSQDTTTIDKLLTYLIAPLDKNSIATNFLAEKGTTILGMNTFNGILNDDNLFVMNFWRLMYVQLQQSFVGSGTNPLPDILNVNNAIQANTNLNTPIPIALLAAQYNCFNDDAIANNLLNYNLTTRQLVDVPNRPFQPLLIKKPICCLPFNKLYQYWQC